MQALVLTADKTLEYGEVPAPSPSGPDSVLVRVAFSGICGSDIHRAFSGAAYRYPLIMGHEFSGEVEEGFEGCRFQPGDRVVAFPLLPCYHCPPCQTGDYAQCRDYSYLGSRRDGGFAEYVYVPEANLFPIPAQVSLLQASLCEPCAVALHGTNKLAVKPGDSAAVFGGGPVGNMIAQWLASRGCHPIYVSDVDDQKLEIAADMGFVPIDSRTEDPVARIRAETDGGVQKAVEACGLPQTFLQTLQAAGRFGEVVFLGNISGDFTIGEKDFSSILRRELTIHGSWNSRVVPRGRDEWSTVLKAMDRKLKIAPLISHTPDLADGAEVFRGIADGSLGPYRKIVFKVGTK